jgi:hypothetical protein
VARPRARGARRPSARGLSRALPALLAALLACAPVPPVEPPREADLPRVGLRRLSRLQYDRTVQDLLGTAGTPAADTWPADDRRHGFDNLGGGAPPSALHAALLFQGAEAAAREAVGTRDAPGPSVDCVPSNACAVQVLTRLAPVALRRPVSPEELSSLVAQVADAEAAGAGFHDALVVPVLHLLTAPELLFRLEHEPGTRAAPLTGPELATRLAYLLWASAPDAALLDGADRLHQPAVLAATLDRMLAAPRADGLVVDFGVQWLDLADSPHPEAVHAHLDAVLRADRPLTDLLDGLLGDAAWLAAGPASDVQRGRRILDTLLCAAPPPPPTDVPVDGDRTDGACAGCHANMDPLGEALAHFDADGLRSGPPTPASLPDGTVLTGAPGVAAWVADDPRFVPCVVQRVFTYAFGRPPEAADAERLAELESAFVDADHRFEALVEATATLPAFRTRAPGPTP